jgi:hypothetical protein
MQTVFGQIKTGTYHITGDTTTFGEGNLFSELIIKKDGTFIYKYRTSSGRRLWYDSEGKWKMNKDRLTLIDTIISYHSVLTLKNQRTDDGQIFISAITKQHKPVAGIKISYLFKGAKDTLSGFTNSEGTFVIDTKNIVATKSEVIDDVEIWAVYVNEKGKGYTTNTFSDLAAKIECIIDDDARNETVIRTTIYKIDKLKMVYLSQQFDKKDIQPGRYLYGDFTFKEE